MVKTYGYRKESKIVVKLLHGERGISMLATVPFMGKLQP
jgi:hypothetical protein